MDQHGQGMTKELSVANEECHDRELSNRQATKKKKRVGRPV